MKYLILVLALFVAACSPHSEQKYDYLQVMPPELADCKIFYVSNGSRGLYITRCGFEVGTAWSESCGKGCTRYYDSATIDRRPENK